MFFGIPDFDASVERWTLDAGLWTLGARLWTLDTVVDWFRTESENSGVRVLLLVKLQTDCSE